MVEQDLDIRYELLSVLQLVRKAVGHRENVSLDGTNLVVCHIIFQ